MTDKKSEEFRSLEDIDANKSKLFKEVLFFLFF